MDYTPLATHLAKWQWDLASDPGIAQGVFDRDEDVMMAANSRNDHYVLEFFRSLRIHKQYNIPFSFTGHNKYSGGGISFFSSKMSGMIWFDFENVKGLTTLSFSKDMTQKTYNRFIINCENLGKIICESESDRDFIFDFINGSNDVFDSTILKINNTVYSYSLIYNELERIKFNLIRSGIYVSLDDHECLILDLPLLMWSMNFRYAGIFLYNWLIGAGEIQMDNNLFTFMDQWELLKSRQQEYNTFIERNKNKRIEQIISIGDKLKLYPLNDIRKYISNEEDKNGLHISASIDSLTNFSRLNILRNELIDNINNHHVASFGTFSIAYNFEGKYNEGNNQIIVDKIFEIINDKFDFEGSQSLGSWQNSIFAPYKPIEKFNVFDTNMLNFTNKTFRDFRIKTQLGVDYRIRGKREYIKNIQIIKLHTNGVEYN
jgi:hypothetical protein